MTTIHRILGCENPDGAKVIEEFKKRKLTMKDYEIVIEKQIAGRTEYQVHGSSQTRSNTPELALMKMMLVYDEVEKK